MTHMMTPPRGVSRATVCMSAERLSHQKRMVARVVKGADLRPAGFGRVGSNPTPCIPAPIAQLVERGAYNRCYAKVSSISHSH